MSCHLKPTPPAVTGCFLEDSCLITVRYYIQCLLSAVQQVSLHLQAKPGAHTVTRPRVTSLQSKLHQCTQACGHTYCRQDGPRHTTALYNALKHKYTVEGKQAAAQRSQKLKSRRRVGLFGRARSSCNNHQKSWTFVDGNVWNKLFWCVSRFYVTKDSLQAIRKKIL